MKHSDTKLRKLISRIIQRERLRWLSIILVLTLIIGAYVIAAYTPILSATDYDFIRPVNIVFSLIRTQFVELIDEEELVLGAVEGMAKRLDDPYSVLMDDRQYDRLQTVTKGHFYGVGMYIGIRDGILTCISPIKDTPAYRGGMMSGDQILYVETNSTKGFSVEQAADMIKGKKGTEVTLDIYRPSVNERMKITLMRDDIKINSIESTYITNEKITYVQIINFGNDTAGDLFKIAEKIDAKTSKGLIIDVRGNPGGLLAAAVQISDMFLKQGTMIVYTKGRTPSATSEYRASSLMVAEKLPIIILVDNGSASASEIITGALMDNKRAHVVGIKTFGKGSVQRLFPINPPKEQPALKLTTAYYYTPSDVCIHKLGIMPNTVISNLEMNPTNVKHMQQLLQNSNYNNWIKGCRTLDESITSNYYTEHITTEYTNVSYAEFERLTTIQHQRWFGSRHIDTKNDLQLAKAIQMLHDGKVHSPYDE